MRPLGDTRGRSEGDGRKAGPDAQGKQEVDPTPGPGPGLPAAGQTWCCPGDRLREAQWPFLDTIPTSR